MIDRYFVVAGHDVKHVNGNWVKYEDHEKVRDELLEALKEAMKEACIDCCDEATIDMVHCYFSSCPLVTPIKNVIEKHTGKPIEEVLQEAEDE